MSVDSQQTTTRVWSCASLADGMEQLLSEANKVDAEELELMKLIEDLYMKHIWLMESKSKRTCITNIYSLTWRRLQDMEKQKAQVTEDQVAVPPRNVPCMYERFELIPLPYI